jgi:hypothetical protein
LNFINKSFRPAVSKITPNIILDTLIFNSFCLKAEDDDKPTAGTTYKFPKLVDPGMDARREIANYNQFMDEIFTRMNGAIKKKRLDPMDLRLQANNNKSRVRCGNTIFTCFLEMMGRKICADYL